MQCPLKVHDETFIHNWGATFLDMLKILTSGGYLEVDHLGGELWNFILLWTLSVNTPT